KLAAAGQELTQQLTVRKDMLNGFGSCHGGITFSLADTALGFAANSYGRLAMTMEGNVSLTKAIHENDVLTATTQELSNGNRIAVYGVTVTNQHGVQVAFVRGALYKLEVEHIPGESSTKP
ncbi:MAG: hotdog fold thioesterase, partial [Planctomycetota bacterium]